MFEHFDDPIAPVPAPLDDVVKRGRRIQTRRRVALVGIPALALVAAVSAAAALQRPSAKKISVTHPPTSTTVRERATGTIRTAPTTVPPTTTSTTPTAPTTVATPVTEPPPDPHDYSMLQVDYGAPLGIDAGDTQVISYTVTNAGSWSVEWTTPPCPLSLWTAGVDDPHLWQPYSTIWPQPVTPHAHACPSDGGTAERLAPGETRAVNQAVVAGTVDANGNVFPTPPGWTSFQAPFMPQCTQPCSYDAANSRSVTVYPPKSPSWLYTLDVSDTELNAPSDGSATVRVTYTNPLAFPVRMPIYGPCWRVETGTAHVDCSGPIPTVTVATHSTTRLVGTVYARTGFAASGKPLPAGRYQLTIADRVPSVSPTTGSEKTVFLNIS
jgi:hypothetical protein